MEIKIKAYAYTIDIITEIRYFCKCNNAVFGKFRIIFTCTNPSKPAANQNHALNAWYALALQGHNTGLCLKAH